ncbi:uncharacterized protein LOC129578122 [Sitodiplosis mosellana]|uniref:uncharacterized protein LOC129578122 n=1 Tax=Sitodiplosis mosellana TaxID=263140 RepID=UPI002444B1A8|nr:uncharacterized protein LOC129578122 [Sitodiplosis mosellana]
MFRSTLTTTRPKEKLILNKDTDNYVSDEIVQYLLTHQINGVRFLYRNYKKHKSSILNDEGGSGKCFQCVAFFDAIFRASTSSRVLVICQRKQNLEHWQYHIECFLRNLSATIADNKRDTQQDHADEDTIKIASLDYVLTHFAAFATLEYDCVILQDQHTQISVDVFERLKQIKATCKIMLCSNDLMENLTYFYEVLKFCDQTGPLTQKNGSSQTLTLDEFKQKFGCSDKSVPKRNIIFKQKNLLFACNDFYMRRLCNQFGSQFPPIKPEDFQIDFDAWKDASGDTAPLNSNAIENDSSPVEVFTNPNNQTVSTVADVSLLNTALTEFSDFDTQMSPLIYSDSEHGDDDQDLQHASQRTMTPDIACNQEHAAKTRALTRASTQNSSRSHTTPTERNFRINFERISPGSKRLNYKQLPIKINSTNPRAKTYLFRSKKQPQANSTVLTDTESVSQFMPRRNTRSTSSTSDVQIITQKTLSPIVISTSEDDRSKAPVDGQNIELNTDTSCPSPDLFSSFTSARSDALSQQVLNSQENQVEQRNEEQNDTFREVFGEPDECDDIDLLSNTNVDIFEITKNSVFDNVLCSADDKITPLKRCQSLRSTQKKSSPSMNCLSGLRVVLPRLNNHQVEQIQNGLMSQTQPSQQSQSSPQILSTSDDVIDLTAHETQKIIEINSDDSVRNREKTPECKQELTPSTRSCLKRHADGRATTDERRKKSPYSRLGWLTSSRTSPRSGDTTPQSRRRLDKWRQLTDESNLKADDIAKVSKPRNLFKEFKSKSKPSQKSRHDIPSTSTAQSPIIFSDQE